MRKIDFVAACLLIALVSCDRPACENENMAFDEYGIDSREYITELHTLIQRNDTESVEYWLESYVEENGKEYLLVNVQNKAICAKALIRMVDWTGMEGIKESKGVGYRGAKLSGLKFDFEDDLKNVELTFKGIDRIID